jgi:uncharacterized protein with FMN-binding domain
MARKLSKNLVALGSAAIVGVYALGYAHTQSSAQQTQTGVAAAPPAISANAPSPSPTPLSTQTAAATAIARAIAGQTSGNAATNAPTAVPTAPPAAASGYRDGSYTGSASNRRGSLSVDVTIQSGRITGAQISSYDMYYPASRIARLPGEVIARQSAAVDMISGSTYSASAFKQAVAQALAQAKA